MTSGVSDILRFLQDYQVFREQFTEFVESSCRRVRLTVDIAPRRLIDAYEMWRADIDRIKKAENLQDGLDHFKQCGLIAYWLRRMSPIVGFMDYSSPNPEDEVYLDGDHQDFRDLLLAYGGEYFAFDWAYKICHYYEQERQDKTERADKIDLSREYLLTVCHFLKCKQVSPHSLFLIFKSLFE